MSRPIRRPESAPTLRAVGGSCILLLFLLVLGALVGSAVSPSVVLLTLLLFIFLLGLSVLAIRQLYGKIAALERAHLQQVGQLQQRLANLVDTMSLLDQAIEQERKTELSTHTAGHAAHDIQNLVTSLLNKIAEIEQKPDLTAQQVEAATTVMRKTLAQLQNLNADVLSMARAGRLPQESLKLLSVEQLVDTSLSAVDDPRLELQLAPDLIVLGDEKQLVRALQNLCRNALEAATRTVRLTATQVTFDRTKSCFLGVLLPQDYVCLEVIDDGAGIAPDMLPKVLDPFFTTKTSGSGLGLNIVARVVKDHKGGLDIAPAGATEPPGCCVRMYLPLCKESATSEVAERVILLHADIAVGEARQQLLAQFGIRSLVLDSAKQLLEVLSTSVQPILIAESAIDHSAVSQLVGPLFTIQPDLYVVLLSENHQQFGHPALLQNKRVLLVEPDADWAVIVRELKNLLGRATVVGAPEARPRRE